MKSLKSHISLIIPLFSILFAIEFNVIIERVIQNYESKLKDDYSIIVVSQGELNYKDINIYENIAKLQEIDVAKFIEELKKKKVELDFEALKKFMPKFYKIYLNHFPSVEELKKIKQKLSLVSKITRVETFSNSHRKIYEILLTLKRVIGIFVGVVALLSLLLILKQIEVWHLEHSQRMYIMSLFGAPLWMRSGILVKIAVLDTFISVVLVFGSYYYIFNSSFYNLFFGTLGYINSIDILVNDTAVLLILGIIISFLSVIYVSLRRTE